MRLISRNVVLILIVILVLCVAGCGRRQSDAPDGQQPNAADKSAVKNQPTKVEPEVESGPTLEFKQQGVTLNWMEKGQVRMSAVATEVKGSEVTRVGELTDFSGKLYENGKLVATVVAPKAVADTVNRIVTATGGVTLKSMERNTTVKAQWMKWYAKDQKVVGDGGVKIESTMGTMQGAAFVADTGMKTITVKDSAKGL
ncbi:MAG: LPS export ABC transporter periplasmic protein LptC [Armatimonadota bacterium]